MLRRIKTPALSATVSRLSPLPPPQGFAGRLIGAAWPVEGESVHEAGGGPRRPYADASTARGRLDRVRPGCAICGVGASLRVALQLLRSTWRAPWPGGNAGRGWSRAMACVLVDRFSLPGEASGQNWPHGDGGTRRDARCPCGGDGSHPRQPVRGSTANGAGTVPLGGVRPSRDTGMARGEAQTTRASSVCRRRERGRNGGRP